MKEAKIKKIEYHKFSIFNLDGLVKSRISHFFWIPAFAGMTIKQLISIRYKSHLTREGGYPVVRTTFYQIVNLQFFAVPLSGR